MTDDLDIESALRSRAESQTATGITEPSEHIDWIAADTIKALRAENARLREALSGLMADYYAARRMGGYSDLDVHSFPAYRKARAAMGESDEVSG